jgi:hypothetical protein
MYCNVFVDSGAEYIHSTMSTKYVTLVESGASFSLINGMFFILTGRDLNCSGKTHRYELCACAIKMERGPFERLSWETKRHVLQTAKTN